MNFYIDNKLIFTLDPTQVKVINDSATTKEIIADLSEYIINSINNRYKECFDILKIKGDKLLIQNGITSIPLDENSYSQLIFSQPNYIPDSTPTKPA